MAKGGGGKAGKGFIQRGLKNAPNGPGFRPAGNVGSSAGSKSPSPPAGGVSKPNPKPKQPMPQWLKDRLASGQQFNKDNWHRYQHNEVPLKNGKRMDSYNPGKEIVERKESQLGDIKPDSAKAHLRQLRDNYPVGEQIADTPKTRKDGIANQRLSGDQILEVPPQKSNISQDVLDYASKHDITIRDVNGKKYN